MGFLRRFQYLSGSWWKHRLGWGVCEKISIHRHLIELALGEIIFLYSPVIGSYHRSSNSCIYVNYGVWFFRRRSYWFRMLLTPMTGFSMWIRNYIFFFCIGWNVIADREHRSPPLPLSHRVTVLKPMFVMAIDVAATWF